MTHAEIDLDQLAREVARLRAVRAVERLIHEQFDASDRGDLDRQADLLSGARVRYVDGPNVLLDVNDRESLYGALKAITPTTADGTPHTHHVVSNVVVDVEDSLERATARFYTTVFRATEGFPLQPTACGVFHDTFDCVDGTWRFVDRVGAMRLAGDPGPSGAET